MKDDPAFHASRESVIRLLAEQSMVRLVTIDSDGWPHVGLHVHIDDGLTVELHLANDDPQLGHIRANGRIAIEVDHVLAFSPSYWVDESDAAHADQFYRCASLRGTPELITDTAAVAEHLRTLLARHQPEGRHAGVEAGHELYAAYIARLTLVRLRPAEIVTKFKLGQKTSESARVAIRDGLRERSDPLARATLDAIETIDS